MACDVPAVLITTYLEMRTPDAFRPVFLEDARTLQILRMQPVDVAYYRFLYQAVGADWRWRDRLLLPQDTLAQQLAAPGVTVDVLYVQGVPAGYIELKRVADETEIFYFGLRPAFIGLGLGGHLLSWGVQSAWAEGAARLWLHTCNLDSPNALNNYQRRGFSIYKVEEAPVPEHLL